MNTDTPLPQEEPAGQNPPDGAIIDYYLKNDASSVIRLEVFDSAGKLVRVYKSDDQPYPIPPVNIPLYWIRPQQILSAAKGAHRFIWDLHTQPLPMPPNYAIAAIYGETAPNPTSPWVMPGKYVVKLTVDGKSYSQPLTVKMDPRVKTPLLELKKQYDLSDKCYGDVQQLMSEADKLKSLQKQVEKLLPKTNGQLATDLKNLDNTVLSLQNGNPGDKSPNLRSLQGNLFNLMNLAQESDMPVTTLVATSITQADSAFGVVNAKFTAVAGDGLKSVNDELGKAGMEKIVL
jgi:hypothetical protein